jgi:hypothetical protein
MPAMHGEKSRFLYLSPMIIMISKFLCYGAPPYVAWMKCTVLLVESYSSTSANHVAQFLLCGQSLGSPLDWDFVLIADPSLRMCLIFSKFKNFLVGENTIINLLFSKYKQVSQT